MNKKGSSVSWTWLTVICAVLAVGTAGLAVTSFEEQSLEELLALFPEGEYDFDGTAIEKRGNRVLSSATFKTR